MAHHCHASECKIPVPPEMFMCRKHWYQLPKDLRTKIWQTYRVGQCDDMNPSKEYCEVAKECVIYLANKEKIAADTQLYDLFLRDKE